MQIRKEQILVIAIMALALNPVSAYYHKFIAENSGTKKARKFLNRVLDAAASSSGPRRYNNETTPRSYSHILFVGTPKSIKERTETANEEAIKAKEEMIAKKKKQKKIDKELEKNSIRYSQVEIPPWDVSNGVSMFVMELGQANMFKGDSSSKVPVDIKILDASGNLACKSEDKLKEVTLSEEEMNYIYKSYLLRDRVLGDNTLHIKYYSDPACLVSNKAVTITLEYETKRGKPIYTTLEMDYFKDAIMRDYDLFDQWIEDNNI